MVGGKERPTELTIDAPAGWKIATGIDHADKMSTKAADYNWFADAPTGDRRGISGESFRAKRDEVSRDIPHRSMIGAADLFSKNFLDDFAEGGGAAGGNVPAGGGVARAGGSVCGVLVYFSRVAGAAAAGAFEFDAVDYSKDSGLEGPDAELRRPIHGQAVRGVA